MERQFHYSIQFLFKKRSSFAIKDDKFKNFSGIRKYTTGRVGVKNKIGEIAASQYPKEEQKIKLKLALSSLDTKSAKDRFLSYNA